ncbi:MAG: cyclic nucleotide-binding domain-containing protein [Betaproteobacteria bacterium]|nr:cyclic nucleotide-binding domain-containing protein [Betaproteobacteria bacterium]
MQDDFDFTKPPSAGPAAPAVAPARFNPAVSKFYDAIVAARLFRTSGKYEQFPAGTTLFTEKERAGRKGLFGKRVVPRMYLVVSGDVTLSANGKLLDIIKTGGIFGEMAVIDDSPAGSTRSATATTKSECHAFSLDAAELQAALQSTPEFALMLMSVMFDRLRFLAARLTVRKIAPGAHTGREGATFTTELLSRLNGALPHATTVRFDAGKAIMREGEPGVCMYVVMQGKVGIFIRDNEVETVIAGGTFGEMALVDQSPRTASAISQTECVLLSVNRNTLLELVKLQPEIGMIMLRSVADRLRHMNSLLA